MLFLHLFHLLPWQQNRIGTINLCLAFYQCLSNLDSYKELSFISSKVSLNANLQPAYDKSKLHVPLNILSIHIILSPLTQIFMILKCLINSDFIQLIRLRRHSTFTIYLVECINHTFTNHKLMLVQNLTLFTFADECSYTKC